MIYLLFSAQSSGSTFLQKQVSKFVDVPRPSDSSINETELALLDWGAYFAWSPNETIDFEPCRTHNPHTGKEVYQWRRNYREYLKDNAASIGRNYWDSNTGDWYTVEKYFLEQIVAPLARKYRLPEYTSEAYVNRVDYLVNLFSRLSEGRHVFGKNPKWLNDFSGQTIRLLEILYQANIPIKGIFLYRCPANTYTSILERKFRLDEMFQGDMDDYESFVFDALTFSNRLGIDLAERFDFFRLPYEDMENRYPELLNYMKIDKNAAVLPGYRKKYVRRYVLNPRARGRFRELREMACNLGYDKRLYPKHINLVVYLRELAGTTFRTLRRHKENVNNPETAGNILKRCFWYEVNTPRALPLKRIYRKAKNLIRFFNLKYGTDQE